MPVEWQTVHEAEVGEVVARVQRRGDYRPLYSIILGRRRQDEPDRLSVFVPIRVDGSRVNHDALTAMQNAVAWIEEEVLRAAAVQPPPRAQREARQAAITSAMGNSAADLPPPDRRRRDKRRQESWSR